MLEEADVVLGENIAKGSYGLVRGGLLYGVVRVACKVRHGSLSRPDPVMQRLVTIAIWTYVVGGAVTASPLLASHRAHAILCIKSSRWLALVSVPHAPPPGAFVPAQGLHALLEPDMYGVTPTTQRSLEADLSSEAR